MPVPDADGNLQYYRMEVVPASQPEESKPSPKPVAKHVAAPVTEPVTEPVAEPDAKHVAEHVTPSVSEAPNGKNVATLIIRPTCRRSHEAAIRSPNSDV